MCYYFRPQSVGLHASPPRTSHTVTATLAPSPSQTTGKFPEYNKVWEDDTLNVVAIFGKYEDGATTASDAGIAAFNEFVGAMKSELGDARPDDRSRRTSRRTRASTRPTSSSTRRSPTARRSTVVALLTDNVNTGLQQPAFRARYEALSTRADFIVVQRPRRPRQQHPRARATRASGSPASTSSCS